MVAAAVRREIAAVEVVCTVAQVTGIAPHRITGADRTPPVSRARQLAAYVLRRESGLTDTAAGGFLRRDRTTVIYAVRQVERRLAAGDTETIRQLAEVRVALEARKAAA